MSRTYLGGALVLGAAVLWGTLGVFAKFLYGAGLSSLELASVRAFVAFVGLTIWMLRRPGNLKLRPRDIPFFAAYGLISIAFFHYLYFATIERTTVAVAVALLYTAPGFVVILSRVLMGEPIGRPKLIALGLVLSGAFLVTGAVRMIATGQATVSGPALLFGLASGLTYGLYTLFGKRALQEYDPQQTVYFAFLFGAAALALVAPPWVPLMGHPDSLVPLLLLGLLPTLAAYLLYIGGLRFLPSGTASMLASAEPAVATLLGYLVLQEAMGLDQVVGIACIIGAALLLARASGGREDAAPEATITAASRSR